MEKNNKREKLLLAHLEMITMAQPLSDLLTTLCCEFDKEYWETILSCAPQDPDEWKDIHFHAEAMIKIHPKLKAVNTVKKTIELTRWLSDRYYGLYRDIHSSVLDQFNPNPTIEKIKQALSDTAGNELKNSIEDTLTGEEIEAIKKLGRPEPEESKD